MRVAPERGGRGGGRGAGVLQQLTKIKVIK